jgi:hypothetical protein
MTIEPRRFVLDVAAERATARLRLFAAAVVVPASAVLATALPTFLGIFVAMAGIGVSIGWVVAFVRARARIGDSDRFSLVVDDTGVSLALGGAPVDVRWTEIREVDLDDERLEVALHRRDGPVVRIPPIFANIALPDLAALLERHRDGATSAARD